MDHPDHDINYVSSSLHKLKELVCTVSQLITSCHGGFGGEQRSRITFLVSTCDGKRCVILPDFSQSSGLCSRFSVTTHSFVLTTNTKSQEYRVVRIWATSAQEVPSLTSPFSTRKWLPITYQSSLHFST